MIRMWNIKSENITVDEITPDVECWSKRKWELIGLPYPLSDDAKQIILIFPLLWVFPVFHDYL